MRTALSLLLACLILTQGPRAGLSEDKPAQPPFEDLRAALSPSNGPPAPTDPLLPGATAWVNADAPLTRAQAHGKLLLLDFWDYTCVNCIRTLPYLKQFQQRYGDKGLLIVGVHMPEFDIGRERANVASAARRFGLTYPIALDNRLKVWGRYNDPRTLSWPYKLLMSAAGKIVYRRAGEGDYANLERRIQSELKRINPKLALPKVVEPTRPEDRPGAWGRLYPRSPELYANWRGVVSHQFGHFVNASAADDYTLPEKLAQDRIHLGGRWRVTREYAQPASGAAAAVVELRFRGNEVNAVLAPVADAPAATQPDAEATPPTTQPDRSPAVVTVLLDGRAMTAANRGADVELRGGRSLLAVDSARMYRLYESPEWGAHRLRLEFADADAGLFAFTFGSRVRPPADKHAD